MSNKGTAAKVRSVLSGDTIIVQHQNGEEKQLSLAYVGSPRLSLTAHEAYGYESREYLRQLLIGKMISYRVLYSANDRDYAEVSAPVFQSLVLNTLENGWTKLRDDACLKPDYQNYQGELERCQSLAQDRQIGVWNPGQALDIHVHQNVPANVYGSGRKIPSIIEKVISGDRIQLRTLFDKDDHYLGQAILAGIRCPRSRSADGSGEEAYGEAAKRFLVTKLLQRSQTRALFVAQSPLNESIPLVTIAHPAGDIVLLMIKEGLGIVQEKHAPMLGSERMIELRKAQSDAQNNGRNLWKLQSERKKRSPSYESTILRVVSSDTFLLEDGKTVQLSSTRAPRRNDPETSRFVAPAREFARKLLIGQKVSVNVDAVRPATESFPERDLVTLSLNGNNVALKIIEEGWATVVRHRLDDLDKSPFINELLSAEQQANSAKKGMHSPNVKAPAKLIDASESLVRAKGYLASLERRGRIPATVEHVSSGGRLRLEVPSENCVLTAVIDGVRVPRPNEDLGEAAYNYTLRHYGQRDVSISVRQVDKTGAFISTIYSGRGSGASNSLAHQLLSEGLASVHESSANASGQRSALDRSEGIAKDSRKGIWQDYTPSLATSENVSDVVPTDALELSSLNETGSVVGVYQDAIVTEVTPDSIWFRLIPNEEKHKQMKTALKSFFGAAANTDSRKPSKKPRRDEIFAVKTANGEYERVRVVQFDKLSDYDVVFIDSGASSTVNLSDIYLLPAEFSIVKIPQLARSTTLKYVHSPPVGYKDSYLQFVRDQTKRQVVVSLSPGGAYVFTEDSEAVTDSLNSRIIAAGRASIPVSSEKEEEAKPLVDMQEQAQRDHIGMWEYGDPREDEDL